MMSTLYFLPASSAPACRVFQYSCVVPLGMTAIVSFSLPPPAALPPPFSLLHPTSRVIATPKASSTRLMNPPLARDLREIDQAVIVLIVTRDAPVGTGTDFPRPRH